MLVSGREGRPLVLGGGRAIFIHLNLDRPALSGEYLLMPLCKNGACDGSKVFSTETSLLNTGKENSNSDETVQVSKPKSDYF